MIRILVSLACLLCAANPYAATLASLGDGDDKVDVCRANLDTDQVRMYWRDAQGVVLGHVNQLRDWLRGQGEKLVCASNAGIFGKDLAPIGLYVEGSKVLRRLNTRKGAYGNFYLQPNGAFLLTGSQALIIATDTLVTSLPMLLPNVRYATQSGPLLLTGGQINPLFAPDSDNRVVRNAVCTMSLHQLALARSRAPISFYDFARVLRDKVGCRDALYLDGSVSRLYPFDSDTLEGSVGPLIAVVAH